MATHPDPSHPESSPYVGGGGMDKHSDRDSDRVADRVGDRVADRVSARRWEAFVLPAWIGVLSALLLGPALRPGFVLSYDMVFVPRQELLPASIGIGGGLPRAVPQDAVVALASTVIDGAWLQHLVLLAIPILAGSGVSVLLRGAGRGAQLVGATLAIWNPFVVERLVQGHWALLLAYAATPWAIAAARRMRATGRGGGSLIGWCALGALVPSGGLLVALTAVPIALLGGVASRIRRVLLLAAVVAINLPWLLPALLHPDSGTAGDAGASVFSLRSEGAWGPVLTALGGGGLWNADAVPGSRGTIAALALTIAVAVAAIAGWADLRRLLGTAATVWWTTVAVAGWSMAVASAVAPGAWRAVITALPGGGLARDSHKLLAPLVLLLAVAAALGVRRAWRRVTDVSGRRSLIAAAMLVPLALLPDAALGAGGRLSAVDYPAQWQQMRDYLAGQPDPGDVVVLPWSAFRDFAFNGGRTVLDPAPRWLTRSTIAADSLPVSRNGTIVVVSGDDPRSAVVARALDQGQPLASVMPALGARWVVVEEGQRPEPAPSALAGLLRVWSAQDLSVWSLPDDARVEDRALPAWGRWVVVVDLLVAAGLAILAAGGIGRLLAGLRRRGWRRGGAASREPRGESARNLP